MRIRIWVPTFLHMDPDPGGPKIIVFFKLYRYLWGRWGFREVGMGKVGNGGGWEYRRWGVRGWEVGEVGSGVGGK